MKLDATRVQELIIDSLEPRIDPDHTIIAPGVVRSYGFNATKIAKKKLPRYFKSLVSLIVGIATMMLYLYKLDASLETVLLSFLICTFGYDLIIKPILKAIKRHFADSKSV